MKIRTMFSLTLAFALQVLPLTRVFIAATPAAGSSYAIIATWMAGAAALLGGVDAVSGASSISISPATATTGVPFAGIVQYSGSHASSAKSWQLTKNWIGNQAGCNTAYAIAPGLWLTNSATYLVRIGGTPTASGTYSFTLKIHSASGCGGGDSDTRSASITISGGAVTAPSITSQPVGQTVTAGGNASFTVGASGSAPLSYQWRQNGANVAGGTSSVLALTGVTTNQAGSYTCVVSNSAGTATSSAATLTVNVAVIAPSITSQPVGQTVTAGGNASFTVGASGSAPLSYQWRRDGANVAGGTSSVLALTGVTTNQAGSYTCVVSNSAGTATSSAATLTVNIIAVRPGTNVFTVITNGNGQIWPSLDPQRLVMGRKYKLTAYPGLNQEFTGWTGSFTSASPSLSFVMTSNLVLQANFIPSPFISVAGTFNGLFYESDEVRQASAGFWNLALNRRGYYSGWLRLGGNRHTFAGRLGFDCQATNRIPRAKASALLLNFAIGTDDDRARLAGWISDGSWASELRGYRTIFHSTTNPAPFAGSYTIALPGQIGNPASPAGDGYGSFSVLRNGQVLLRGTLGDKTEVNQTAWVSEGGLWPLHASLYEGRGQILGWLRFKDRDQDDVRGEVRWIKPPNSKAKYYPAGFSEGGDAIGSRYQSPVGTNSVLAATNATIAFSGGNLPSDFANTIRLGTGGKATNLSSNQLTMNFTLSRGTYSGTVVDPASGAKRSFQGVVLQKRNEGFGLLTGTNQTSRVRMVPAGPASGHHDDDDDED